MLKKFFVCALSATVIAALLTACAAAQPTATPIPTKPQLVHIKLPMGYIPNVQFAPFYVAVEKGYFKDAGIEVDFDYAFETDGVALVGADTLQFGIASGDQVLQARSKNLPIVYVAAWYQKFPVSIISIVDQNIHTPQDLKGKKIGLPGLFGASYVGLRAVLHGAGLQESDVTLDSIGFNQVEAFTTGKDPIIVGYAANEPVVLQGFTDSVGAQAYNEQLSNERAQSVRDYLIQQGVPPQQIQGTEGLGEQHPVASNDTSTGRANNRRVEIVLPNFEQAQGAAVGGAGQAGGPTQQNPQANPSQKGEQSSPHQQGAGPANQESQPPMQNQ